MWTSADPEWWSGKNRLLLYVWRCICCLVWLCGCWRSHDRNAKVAASQRASRPMTSSYKRSVILDGSFLCVLHAQLSPYVVNCAATLTGRAWVFLSPVPRGWGCSLLGWWCSYDRNWSCIQMFAMCLLWSWFSGGNIITYVCNIYYTIIACLEYAAWINAQNGQLNGVWVFCVGVLRVTLSKFLKINSSSLCSK